MYAGDKSSELPEQLRVIEFRRPAAVSRIDRKAETVAFVQRPVAKDQRRDDRDLGVRKFDGKRVLFEDRSIRPALRPIELGDNRRAVFDTDLVDAVFVAVQRKEGAVACEPEALDRADYVIRPEILVREIC